MRVGNLDPHETQLEELGDQGGVHPRRLLHRGDARPDFLIGEVPHRALKHLFFFRETGQRLRHQTFLSPPPVPRSISRMPPSELSTPVAS